MTQYCKHTRHAKQKQGAQMFTTANMTDEDLDAMMADTNYWADYDAKHGIN